MTTQIVYDGKKAFNVDLLHGDIGWNMLGNDAPLDEDVRRYYEYVGLLYRCVHIRAHSLSKVPWVITNDQGETLWKKGDAPPPQLAWLANLPRLLHKTEAALTLGAQAYWHKERNRVRFTGLRWLAPLATAPYWDAERGLTHFVRNIGVRVERIPPQDMVYLRYEYPLHETLRDRSPAEAALRAAGVLYNVDQFAATFFDRGAIKATLLTIKGNPPKEERERLKAWWHRVFTGVKNAFKTEIVSADAVTPVVVGEGIGELSNTELTGEKRNDIVITMGIPLSMVFSDAANYATAEQDEKNFYNSTIIPECDLIAEQVDEQLLAELGYHLVFRPEAMDIFQTDENERAGSFSAYVAAGLKRSMVAEMLGLELPDGWEYDDLDDEEEEEQPTAGANTNPAAGENGAGAANPDEEEEDDPAKASEIRRFKAWAKRRKNPDPTAFHSRLLSAAEKAAILEQIKGGGADQDFFRLSLPDGPITPSAYKALVLQLDPEGDDEAEQRIREGIEQRFERELAKAFDEQLTNLLPDDASDDVIRSTASQVEATSEPIREVLRRELEASSSLGVTVALDTLERIGLGFDWTLAHTEAARWASQYSYELVRGINATTRTRLQQAIDDWFRERTTLRDLVRELQPTFGRKRARQIAQTETTRAAREGSIIGYEQSGVVRQAEWVTVADERVCPICGALHGQRTTLRGTFANGQSYPPAHPGCRCFVRPVIDTPSDSRLIAATQPPTGPQGTIYEGNASAAASGEE